jgi:hypothetical protein
LEETETTQSAADTSDGEWSEKELDDVSPTRRHFPDRGPLGLSDDQLRKAGLLFGIIILGFVGLGISLSQFFPERRGAEFLNCAHIARSDERLSCYDKAAVSAAAPFKGGAPFSTYSRADLTTSG